MAGPAEESISTSLWDAFTGCVILVGHIGSWSVGTRLVPKPWIATVSRETFGFRPNRRVRDGRNAIGSGVWDASTGCVILVGHIGPWAVRTRIGSGALDRNGFT